MDYPFQNLSFPLSGIYYDGIACLCIVVPCLQTANLPMSITGQTKSHGMKGRSQQSPNAPSAAAEL